MAYLAQVLAVGVELQELRGRRAIGGAGCIAAMQDEDVALGIERDPRNLAKVEIGRQAQDVRNGFIADDRRFLGAGEAGDRERHGASASSGEKSPATQGPAQRFAAAGTGRVQKLQGVLPFVGGARR